MILLTGWSVNNFNQVPPPRLYNSTMRNRSTRRQFALGAAAASALTRPASAQVDEKMAKAPEMAMDPSDLDPVKWTQDRYVSAPLRLTFRATNRADAEAWQRELRTKLTELLGGFPDRTS